MPKKLEKFIGVNNVDEEESLSTRELRSAVNVDLTDRGFLKRRSGYELLQAGDFHSLWNDDYTALVVQGTTLNKVGPDFELTQLVTGLQPGLRMTYTSIGTDVYYANGLDTGVLLDGTEARPWGVEVPNRPTLSIRPTGGCSAGTYHVKLTFSDDLGEEGGASAAASIAVGDNQGIQILVPTATQPTVSIVNVYVTPTDGEQYYLAASIPVGAPGTSFNGAVSATPLETDGIYPPTPGRIVGLHNGRILFSDGKVLWFTEALAYGRVNRAKNFYLYPAAITDGVVVEGGVFIGADRTYFLGGDTVAFEQSTVSPGTLVAGTAMTVDGKLIGDGETTGEVAVWASERGFILGLPNGAVEELTSNKVSFPVGTTGASQLINKGGISSIVTTLKDPAGSGMALGDRVTAEVRRNGVVII